MFDLSSMGEKWCDCVGRRIAIDDYVQCGPFDAVEEGCHIVLALSSE